MQEKKIKKSYLLLILSPLLLLVIYLIFNTFNNGNIQGIIVDSSDSTTLLTGTKINLDNKQDFINNDLTGTFNINNIKTGEHIINVSREGYQPYTQKISLGMGENLKLNIKLLKSESTAKDNIKIACTTLNNNSVAIINTSGNNNIIETGERPLNVIYSNSKQKIYSQSISEGFITVIDEVTNSKIKDIKFDQKYQIKKIALSSSGDKLYAYAIEANKIYIIDTATDNIISSIDLSPITIDFSIDDVTGNVYVIRTEGINVYSSSGGLISTHNFTKPDFFSKILVINNKAFLSHSTNNFILEVDLVTNNESNISTNGTIKDIINDSQNVYVLLDSGMSIIPVNNVQNVKNVSTNNVDNSVMSLSKDKSKIYIADKSEVIQIFDIANQSISSEKIKAKSNIRYFIEI